MQGFVKLGRKERRALCLLAAAFMASDDDDAESVTARAEGFEHFVDAAEEAAAVRESA